MEPASKGEARREKGRDSMWEVEEGMRLIVFEGWQGCSMAVQNSNWHT